MKGNITSSTLHREGFGLKLKKIGGELRVNSSDSCSYSDTTLENNFFA